MNQVAITVIGYVEHIVLAGNGASVEAVVYKATREPVEFVRGLPCSASGEEGEAPPHYRPELNRVENCWRLFVDRRVEFIRDEVHARPALFVKIAQDRETRHPRVRSNWALQQFSIQDRTLRLAFGEPTATAIDACGL